MSPFYAQVSIYRLFDYKDVLDQILQQQKKSYIDG